jgi:Tetracyclin repressor-like, C-terminal domain
LLSAQTVNAGGLRHVAVQPPDVIGSLDSSNDGDWRARLEAVLMSYTTVLFEHPGLAQSALVARPSGTHYLRLIEGMLALLAEGGVPGGQAAWGVDLLLLFTTATAAEHAADRVEGQDEWDALAGALRGLSDRTHPHAAALAEDLMSGEPMARLSWGLRALISGIAQTPTPSTQQGASS